MLPKIQSKLLKFKKINNSSDNNFSRMLLFSLVVISVVVLVIGTTTAATEITTAFKPQQHYYHHNQDAMIIGNNNKNNEAALEQQLASEKMQALGVAVSAAAMQANDNNKYLDNHSYQLDQNDLVEKPEVEFQASAADGLRSGSGGRQAQAQQSRMLGQGVINGNHATYVEPPADFKPIIYGLGDNDNNNNDDDGRQAAAAAVAAPQVSGQQQQQQVGSGLDGLMLNQLVPVANGHHSLSMPANQPSQSHQSDNNSNSNSDNQRPAASESLVSHQNQNQDQEISANSNHHQVKPEHQHKLKRQRWEKDFSGQPLNDGASDRPKPSIGRWSDWYDLGIEPDLATSDTLGSNQYLPATSQHGQVAHAETSKGQAPALVAAEAEAPSPSPPSSSSLPQSDTKTSPVASSKTAGQVEQQQQQQQTRLSDGVGGQQQNLAQQLRLKQLIEQVNSMPTNGGFQQQQQLQPERRRPMRFVPGNLVKRLAAVAADFRSQIKGSPASLNAQPIAQAHDGQQQGAGALTAPAALPPAPPGIKMALNSWMASHLNNLMELQQQNRQNFNQLQDEKTSAWDTKQPQQVEVKQLQLHQRQWQPRKTRKLSQYNQHQHHHHHQLAAAGPTTSDQWEQQQVLIPILEQQTKSATYLQQQQQPIRQPRRRQSKSHNAEVEIKQLVANSQLQHELLSSPTAKQVNGLVIYHGQPYHQQHHQWLQQQQMHRLQQQQQVLDPPVPNQHQLGGGQRVYHPAPAIATSNVNANAKQQQTHHHSAISGVAKKLKPHPSQPLANTNSTSAAVAAAAAAKRQVKKRRIKTLLPVGLSSWFLGGIRDLDGRHWHLPADVINRLAVNDVDFVGHNGYQTPNKVVPPSAGSVELIGAGQESNTTTSGPTSEPPAGVARVPLRKVVPR